MSSECSSQYVESLDPIAAAPRLSRVVHVYAIVLAATSVIFTGYRVYTGNQSLQIPLVHSLNDPGLYPNDPFAATLDAYCSPFWRVVAVCARSVPLEPLLLAMFLVERLLLAYAAASLATAMRPRSLLAAVSAMALIALAPKPLLGGATIIKDYLDHTGFAVCFYVFGMAALIRGRAMTWAVCCGLGFNCNIMYGAFAMSYYAAGWLVDPDLRARWKRWLVGVAVMCAVAAPAIWLAATTTLARTPGGEDMWLQASLARLKHHLFPSSWDTDAFVAFGLLHGLAIVAFVFAGGLSPRIRRYGLMWALIGGGWLAYAFLAEHLGSSTMLIMQAGRGPDLWCIFATIALICILIERANHKDSETGVLGVSLAAMLFWWRPPAPRVVLAALVLIGLAPLKRLLPRTKAEHLLSAVLTALVLLAAVDAARPRFRRAKTLAGAVVQRPAQDDFALAKWAEENTPIDALFLTHPGRPAPLRMLARRPLFVTWKDGSALLWDRSFAETWLARLEAIGVDVGEAASDGYWLPVNRAYDRLGDDDVRRLAAEYGVRYWVVAPGRESSFKVEYENASYKVLSAPDVAGGP